MILILSVLASVALALDQSAIFVVQPKEVKNRLPYVNYTIADFGYVPYGHQLLGHLVIADPNNGCDRIVPHADTHKGILDQMTASNLIYVVERGDCTFVTKAYNAQQAGAQMLIVIDTNEGENPDSVTMISDHLHHVQIPTVMISKQDGDALRRQMNSTKDPIQVLTEFQIIQKDVVDLKYYLTSSDAEAYQFLVQFDPFYYQLIDRIDFTPRYVIYYCQLCQTLNWTITDDNCLSGGRYCSPDPDGAGALTGRDVLKEDIRQVCIHRKEPQNWWKYMYNFYTNCIKSLTPNVAECSESTMQQVGIDYQKIKKCYSESFVKGEDEFSDNTILGEQKQLFQSAPVQMWPSLYINGQFYKGDLYFEDQSSLNNTMIKNISNYAVLEAVCAAFVNTSIPQVCDNKNVFHITDQGQLKYANSKTSSDSFVWLVVITTLILVIVLSFYFYRRMLRREVHEELQHQVEWALSNYYKMNESLKDKDKRDEIV